MDDALTYALLKSTKTNTRYFQLESRGMKDLIRRLQPDRSAILSRSCAVQARTLQSGMVEDFMRASTTPPAQRSTICIRNLKPVLAATYGVILYQEQVMQIAQILAATPWRADLLRRAMARKAEEMAKQRSVFVSGAVARGVREAQATHIFDLMEKVCRLTDS